jgi:hypothetical protein
MIYVFKLGPIQTGEGACHAFIGIRDDGTLSRPVLTASSKEGLRQLTLEATPGQELRCEPGLARSGAALGYQAAAMPAWAKLPRAELATVLALGPRGLHAGPGAIHLLLHGLASFLRAKPWRYWQDQDVLAVTVEGAMRGTYEASVMGAAAIEYGVALYREAGACARIAASLARGLTGFAAAEDGLAVTVDDEPAFAARAIGEAYGIRVVPVPVGIEGKKARPVDSADLALLGGTLRLLAVVTPRHHEAEMTFGDDDEAFTIRVTAPQAS